MSNFSKILLCPSNLQHQANNFEQITDYIFASLKQKDANLHAHISISESLDAELTVRQQQLEHLEQSQSQGLGLTLYLNERTASVSSADFSYTAINQLINHAYDILKHSQPDSANGLPNQEYIATQPFADIDVYHPHTLNIETIYQNLLSMESCLQSYKAIQQSDGCGFGQSLSHALVANSHGFKAYHQDTDYSYWASAIAGNKQGMQSDSWASYQCAYLDLMNFEAIAHKAASRAIAKLSPKSLSTRKSPVIFSQDISDQLISYAVRALSGEVQYHQTGFLNQSLGQAIMPSFINVYEDPFVKRGLASCQFDNKGIAVKADYLIKQGVVQNYQLSDYYAKKMGKKPTGHTGGHHNLYLQVDPSHQHKDLNALMAHMQTGLLVIDTMGTGFNPTNGDYSKGCNGFWIEGGEIAYPVEGITIAGQMHNIYQNIIGVANDAEFDRIESGSILINEMTIAGH